jgi:hypothetical protein
MLLFESEKSFEQYIRKIISDKITSLQNSNIMLLENKDVVDIIVCRNTDNPKIFFMETKFFKSSHGRINFGGPNGNGFQPEILLKRPKYFEENMRWIFGKEGDTSIYVLTSEECTKYYSGGILTSNKQNNFQYKLFNEIRPFTEDDFVKNIYKWITY